MAKTAYKELVANVPAPVGGIRMDLGVHQLGPDEAVDISGFEFMEEGVIGIPWGPVNLGQVVTSKIALSAHIFQRETGATQLIVHISDGSLRYSSNFLTAGTATWTVIASGLSTTQPFAYATYLDEVFMTNGVDDYRKWDGATQTLYSAVPKMRYLAVWKDVMWGAGETANPHRVRQSDPGNASSWPSLGFVDIEKGREFGITGIVGVVNELVVFKGRRTLGIYDPVELTNRLVDADKGAVSHFGIVSHQGQLFFVSHLGVCAYLGDAPSAIVSQNISPVFHTNFFDYPGYSQIRDYSLESRIWACSFEDRIDFRIPMNQGMQSFSFYPSMPKKPWLRSGFVGEVGLAVREKNLPAEQYEFVSGQLRRRYDADASVVSNQCRWVSGWFDMDAPTYEKYLYMAQVFNRGPISMFIQRDYNVDERGNPYNILDGAEEQNIGFNPTSLELLDHTVYLDSYGRCFQIMMVTSNNFQLFQRVSAADFTGNQTKVSRYASGIGRVILRARQLTEGYR